MEVYIPWYSYWLGVAMMVLRGVSEHLRVFFVQLLMGDGMLTLKSGVNKTQEKKKN